MKNIIIQPDLTIRQAMKILNKTAKKCLLVIDNDKKLLGTLTDGDLRRGILSGKKVSTDISKCYNKKPVVINQIEFNEKKARKLLRDLKLDLIPIVNNEYIVVDYITHSNKIGSFNKNLSKLDIPVVIMAGGKGARMEPFTKILPKPLVPINEKPIIEHIIDSFNKLGFNQFYLTVNYKRKIIKAYFEELKTSYKVNFVNEDIPLGTAGSLRFLIGKFKQPFFVSNCDIIIKTNYKSIYRYHQEGNYDITLVASTKEYIIPYGTCQLTAKGDLSKINEKPKYELLINSGLYVINPGILELIPNNKYFHITNLIEQAKKSKKRVGVFPIDDDEWIDIGQWAEYKKALDIF